MLWVLFNKNGQVVYRTNAPGTSPSGDINYSGSLPFASTTNYQIYAVFQDINEEHYGDASIRFYKPDLKKKNYWPLLMTKKTEGLVYKGTTNDGFTNNETYYGWFFDFSQYDGELVSKSLLDTQGIWRAVVTLYSITDASVRNVVGSVLFEVGDGNQTESPTELELDELLEDIYAKLSQMLPIKSPNYFKAIGNIANFDPDYFNAGDIILDRSSKYVYQVNGQKQPVRIDFGGGGSGGGISMDEVLHNSGLITVFDTMQDVVLDEYEDGKIFYIKATEEYYAVDSSDENGYVLYNRTHHVPIMTDVNDVTLVSKSGVVGMRAATGSDTSNPDGQINVFNDGSNKAVHMFAKGSDGKYYGIKVSKTGIQWEHPDANGDQEEIDLSNYFVVEITLSSDSSTTSTGSLTSEQNEILKKSNAIVKLNVPNSGSNVYTSFYCFPEYKQGEGRSFYCRMWSTVGGTHNPIRFTTLEIFINTHDSTWSFYGTRNNEVYLSSEVDNILNNYVDKTSNQNIGGNKGFSGRIQSTDEYNWISMADGDNPVYTYLQNGLEIELNDYGWIELTYDGEEGVGYYTSRFYDTEFDFDHEFKITNNETNPTEISMDNSDITFKSAGHTLTLTSIYNKVNETIDNTVQSGSTHPVTSGAVYSYVESHIANAIRFKGTVADLTALNLVQNPDSGDMYWVTSENAYYVYNGSSWNNAGGGIDLNNDVEFGASISVAGTTIASGGVMTSEIRAGDDTNSFAEYDDNEFEWTVNYVHAINLKGKDADNVYTLEGSIEMGGSGLEITAPTIDFIYGPDNNQSTLNVSNIVTKTGGTVNAPESITGYKRFEATIPGSGDVGFYVGTSSGQGTISYNPDGLSFNMSAGLGLNGELSASSVNAATIRNGDGESGYNDITFELYASGANSEKGLVPNATGQSNLGSSTYKWKNLFLSGNLSDGANSVAVANIENTSNKVTSLSASSTDTQYPSAKCVYDSLANAGVPIITCTGDDTNGWSMTPAQAAEVAGNKFYVVKVGSVTLLKDRVSSSYIYYHPVNLYDNTDFVAWWRTNLTTGATEIAKESAIVPKNITSSETGNFVLSVIKGGASTASAYPAWRQIDNVAVNGCPVYIATRDTNTNTYYIDRTTYAEMLSDKICALQVSNRTYYKCLSSDYSSSSQMWFMAGRMMMSDGSSSAVEIINLKSSDFDSNDRLYVDYGTNIFTYNLLPLGSSAGSAPAHYVVGGGNRVPAWYSPLDSNITWTEGQSLTGMDMLGVIMNAGLPIQVNGEVFQFSSFDSSTYVYQWYNIKFDASSNKNVITTLLVTGILNGSAIEGGTVNFKTSELSLVP